MFKDWKISIFNGVLIAWYFIPAWGAPALRIMSSPVRGLYYERANVAAGMFVSDHLQFGALAVVRFAWLLALAKITVVAFFAVFVFNALRTPTRDNSEESLGIALILATVVSFVSMLLAAKVGEVSALRLHATETLLLLSIGIVMMVESAKSESVKSESKVESNGKPATAAAGSYPQAQPSAIA